MFVDAVMRPGLRAIAGTHAAAYPDMVLVHGGGPGAEKIAARWAEHKGVHQVVCRPDWSAHGKAAPFRRNDQLLSLLPKGLISFPGSASARTWSTKPPSCASRSTAFSSER